MYTRKLTGKWFLKKKLFNYCIMVETEIQKSSDTLRNTNGNAVLKYKNYEKARDEDILQLGINIV